jgi:hypothetical protein
VSGKLAPVLALDERESLPVREKEGIEPGYEEEKNESKVPIPPPKSERGLGPEEKNGEKEDEKEGSQDDDVEKDKNSPKFHATPLL